MEQKLLAFLKERGNTFVSGEEMGRRLGVSRAAISKAIGRLAGLGYEIERRQSAGYRLLSVPDWLYEWEVAPLLTTSRIGRTYRYFDTLDSTNSYAKKLALFSFDDGTLIVAQNQTAGRGRQGRVWSSAGKESLYASILLRPALSTDCIPQITLLTAQVICAVLRDRFSVDARIKWPNDIVCGGRKLCGILTELGTQEQRIEYLVVGFGINVNETEHSLKNLAPLATSILRETGVKTARRQLLAEVLNRFEPYYDTFCRSGSINFFLEDYRKNCVNIGRELSFSEEGRNIPCIGEDVDHQGRLIVRLKDGTCKRIWFGEVHVAGIYCAEDSEKKEGEKQI